MGKRVEHVEGETFRIVSTEERTETFSVADFKQRKATVRQRMAELEEEIAEIRAIQQVMEVAGVAPEDMADEVVDTLEVAEDHIARIARELATASPHKT